MKYYASNTRESINSRFIIFIVFWGFHIKVLSINQFANDSINCFYDKAMSAHEKGDYKEMFVNLCYFIKNQTNTTNFRLEKAYYYLGHLYAHDHYVKQNIDSAVYCFEKASSYGNSDASRYLFNIYYYSSYNRVNKQEAIKWLKISAHQGNIKSSYELGELYDFGRTTQLKDSKNKNGSIVAIQTKSIIIIPNLVINKRTAYEYYENALSLFYEITNQKVGFYEVAVAYMDGTFFDKDYSKAFEYLKYFVPDLSDLSRNLSNYSNPKIADSLWRLSLLYRFGLGTTDNENKANVYLRYAAQCGHDKALKALSTIESQ